MYRERGISVHPEWEASFQSFIDAVGRAPSAKHSLDRIDNDRGYVPGNVRWATQRTQSRNTRANLWIEFRGERLMLIDWAARLGIRYGTLRQRIARDGWSVERALTTPLRHETTTGAIRS